MFDLILVSFWDKLFDSHIIGKKIVSESFNNSKSLSVLVELEFKPESVQLQTSDLSTACRNVIIFTS